MAGNSAAKTSNGPSKPEGEIKTWTKNYAGLAAPQRFDLGYDNADQLTTAPLKNANTSALIKQYTYGYDPASNRTSELAGAVTTTSTPNNVNEIVSQSGGVNRTLTYDLNGSITSDGGTRTFEWDGANRLVAINYTGFTTRSEFTYDGLSRMVKIVEKTGATINSTRKFVWHGQEKLEFRDAADAVTLRLYAQGQFGGNKAYFYTRDHLGSIREMLGSTGTVVARYDYDPFGRSTTILASTPTDMNFTGLYRHAKSNLDLATYRAYDPDLGRWLNRDPIEEEGGLNLYGYVENNPVNDIDPTGENPILRALLKKFFPKLFPKKAPPKPSPKFKPPTNPPSNPPDPSTLPPGTRCYRGKPTEQYPDGYWKIEKWDGQGWQRLDPRTMKPGPHPDTHVPMPPGYKGPFD